MDLIVETDLGRDPDDFFAICYLIAAGVDIRAILISPGDLDQVSIARFICDRLGLKIPVGVAVKNRTKKSSGSIHYDLLNKYKFPLESKPDGFGEDIVGDVFKRYPNSELFVIGPVTSVGNYLANTGRQVARGTMQGGFLSYDLYSPVRRVEQFEGKSSMPTFNLNGDRQAGVKFLAANIFERRMVGKNVCHTVLFTKEELFKLNVKNAAAKLFQEAGELYFVKHESKKFHDPTAACLHLHPEIGIWLKGKTIKMDSAWGTIYDPDGDYILADINHDLLWDHILNFK